MNSRLELYQKSRALSEELNDKAALAGSPQQHRLYCILTRAAMQRHWNVFRRASKFSKSWEAPLISESGLHHCKFRRIYRRQGDMIRHWSTIAKA